ncbi:MAG TPA: tripartite tricarboxylate transporter substrate-binding protein [Xanthobacteraceae bacterium]|jgi:tripartite-type tricarboxylate transporter receptor subunit TctC
MRGQSRRLIAALLSLLPSLYVIANVARAQDYPIHAVRLISDSAPGSSIDVTMRVIAAALSRAWGQQAVLINQPGGGGAIAARATATAAPDGYTLGMMAFSDFVAVAGTADNLPIQVPRDFTPIGYLGGAPMFVTAAPWLGVKTLPELIALAKKRPGDLAYGSNGPGRLTHLTGELLQRRAGIKLLMVPYSGGTAQVLNDMMGGRIALAFDSYSGVAGAIAAGNARPLAVASAERMALFPRLPTVAETLPGFEAGGWQVLVAPPGTPDAIVRKANADLIRVVTDPAVRKQLAQIGRDQSSMSPAETLAFIQSEQQKWAPIVQEIARAR